MRESKGDKPLKNFTPQIIAISFSFQPFIGFIGLSSVFFAVIASYGICSAMGLLFSPMHNIVPFLLLGKVFSAIYFVARCHTVSVFITFLYGSKIRLASLFYY